MTRAKFAWRAILKFRCGTTPKSIFFWHLQGIRRMPVSMFELRLINKRSGETDKSIELDCMAGMIMTTIYTNISAGPKPGKSKVGFQRRENGLRRNCEHCSASQQDNEN